VGEDATNREQFHTLVLSSNGEESGVTLTRPEGTDEDTQLVLIAGEPLDQPVVQVGLR
jgi:hypothetical protein